MAEHSQTAGRRDPAVFLHRPDRLISQLQEPRNMHVAMITGSKPPDICGVGDYTYLLVKHLEEQGIKVTYYYTRNWQRENFKRIVQDLKFIDADIYHLQYPTHGYSGSKILVFLMLRLWRERTVVTIHEFSNFVRWRHLGLPTGLLKFLLFGLSANELIFNDSYEAAKYERWAPWCRNRCTVIPNGPTVPRACSTVRHPKVVFFGQIIRTKMIEDFFKLFELSRQRDLPLEFEIIGGYPDSMADIAEGLLERARCLGIDTATNLSKNAVAERLAGARYAYLPFADGAHPKRTSLLAALENRLIVLTPHSAETPEWVQEATANATRPAEAVAKLELMESNVVDREALTAAIEKHRSHYDWVKISGMHRDLYSEMLKSIRLVDSPGR